MAVRTEDVVAAYRLILGRYPESEDVVKCHASARNIHHLRDAFLNSDEFRKAYLRRQKADVRELTLYLPVTLAPLVVDVACSQQEFSALFQRLSDTWKDLGQERPHWSVLTDSEFLPDSINANIEEFHQTGRQDLEIIRSVLARCMPSFVLEAAEVAEYGCGVGRVTAHLSKECKAVFACDVSASHLDLARAHAEDEGLGNVSFHVVTENDLGPAPECDLWFSRIVLQHNPPPVIAAILEKAFSKIRRGGVAIFQVPVYYAGYEFDVSKYLGAKPSGQMEMHVLPQSHIFRIAAASGLQPLEVREDNSVRDPYSFISNLFCFVKR